MEELIGFCRACLVKYDDPHEMVNSSEKNRRLFMYCTGLQIKRTDMFTVQLCKGCFMLMKMSCVFKKQARTSDKKFQNYMGLKEEAAVTDFCTFLKNTDKTFRLPLNGSSTPQQQPREEDNESTCTSIRNFITDILRPEEIPESEAKIIDEVFDEELNTLDDSLDSHWFEDTMDQDYNFDFSLSPFASPRFNRLTPNRASPAPKYQFPEPEPYRPGVEPATRSPDVIDRNLEKALTRTTGEIFLDDLLVSPADSNIMPDMNKDNTMDVLDNILFGENIETHSKPNEIAEKYENIDTEPNILDDFFKPPTEKPKFYVEYDENMSKVNDHKHIEEKQTNTTDIVMTIEKDDIKSEPEEKIELEALTIKHVKLKDILHPTDETLCSLCEWKARDIISLKIHLSKKHMIRILKEKPILKTVKLEELFNYKSSCCYICGYSLSNMKSIKAHMRNMHQVNVLEERRPRKTVVCEVCGKEGIDTGNYKRHLASHNKQKSIFMCDYCKLEFSTKSALIQHIVSHPEMYAAKKHVFSRARRPCLQCGARVSNMAVHVSRHNNTRVHACAVCQKSFHRACDYKAHLASKHRKEVYTCKRCGKTYKCFTSLATHTTVAHSDSELPKCHICGNVFLRRNNLLQHLKKNKLCSGLAKTQAKVKER